MARGGRGELDRQEHGAEMPFELGRQGIDMVPVKGGFVEVGRAREVVGNACAAGRGARIPKACARTSWNGVASAIRSSVNRCSTCPAFCSVSLLSVRAVYTRSLATALAVLRVLPDVMNQAGNQVVMEALIAVDDKAEQIEVRSPHRQPFELIDGVIADQGRIVLDAFVGNLQRRAARVGPARRRAASWVPR